MDGLGLFSHLSTLNLQKNKIKNLDGIEGAHSLKFLDLSYNEIENCQNLSKLNLLIFLDLSYNQIKEIQSLFDLKELVHLRVMKNLISNIDSKIISTNIKVLNLSDNTNLSSIKHLGSCYNLEALYLNHCKLAAFSLHNFLVIASLPQIKIVEACNNDWSLEFKFNIKNHFKLVKKEIKLKID